MDETAPPGTAIIGSAAGVAWYPPGTYTALRHSGVHLGLDSDAWDDWFATYQRTFLELKGRGLRPFKIVVEADALADWLTQRGLGNTEDNRHAYVRERLAQILDLGPPS